MLKAGLESFIPFYYFGIKPEIKLVSYCEAREEVLDLHNLQKESFEAA